jgi:PAS domain S-box-containing protein
MIFILDRQNRVEYVNEFAAQSIGREVRDIIGKQPMEFFSAETSSRQRNSIQQVFKTGKPVYYEGETQFSGRMIWLGTWLTPIKNVMGEVVSILGIARDITDRKQAEDALSESEARYRLLFELSPDAIAVYQSGKVVFVNQAAASLIGAKAPEELIGKPMLDFVHPDYRKFVLERSRRQMIDGQAVPVVEEKFVRLDGSFVDVDVTAAPFRYHDQPAIMAIIRNITERKQAEEARSESEERFRHLYENATIGLYRTSPDGKILLANPSIVHLLGYASFEELAKRDLEKEGFEPEYSRSEFRQRIESQGQVVGLEVPWKRKDGTTIFVRESAKAIRDADGKVLYYEGTVEDITERRRAEEALQQSEERFREIFENMSSGVVVYEAVDGGKDFKINNFNRAAEGIEKISRESIIGRLVSEAFPGVREMGLFDVLQRVWKSGEPEHLPASYYQDRREAGWRENYVARLPSGEIVAIYDDVTERKRAEQALRASEARFSTVFHLSPLSIAVTRLADNTIIDVNDAWQALTGYTREGAVGRSALEINSWDEPEERKRLVSILHAQGTVLGFEFRLRHKSGQLRDCLISAELIELAGEACMLSMSVDITERKQAEEAQVRQAEELARLYRATGSLLSRVPFDLQSLAQTIVEVVLKEFGQSNCSVFLVQKETNALIRVAVAGPYADQVRKITLTLDGPGQVPEALRTRRVINTPDVRKIPAYVPSWEAAHSELTIPLQIADQVIGAIDVQSAEASIFSADDERMMSIFAERAALSLEHARLFAQTEHRLNNLASLRTVDLAISSSFDLDITLGILLDQVIKQLDIDAADVLVFNPGTQTFHYSTGQGFHTQALRHTNLRLGDGYAGRAARERHTIRIQNLEQNLAGLQRSLEFSREGFVAYMGVPLIAKGQIKGVLEILQRKALDLDQEEAAFLEMLAGQAAIAIDNTDLFYNLQSTNTDLILAYDSTLAGWASALELRDKETEGHTRRVADLTTRLAETVGVNESELVHIHRGALLHDIGKMGIPDSIVLKPGPLSEEEWGIMRKHPQYAFEMISPISYLQPALDIPYCHHEKWDGGGYPRGLKGEQIPLAARIFAVVDVWDALTSDRPYRKAWQENKVRDYIREQSGRHFDPKIVEVFLGEVLNAERR